MSEIRDKDNQAIFTVERHHGGVALVSERYGGYKTRTWFHPHVAKVLGEELIAKAAEPRPD